MAPRRRARVFAALVALTAVLFLTRSGAASVTANAGGMTAGQFSTTPTGAAIFQIPIQVPPGIQGLHPELSLVYSSQNSANSEVGVGWRLRGLSRIERCARTIAVDGQRGDVTNNYSDRLCLDGVRLVARQAYSDDFGYWAAASYSKESEDWSEIKPVSTCAGGPCGYDVHLPNGRIMRYGVGTNAQVFTTGLNDLQLRPIRTWLLHRIFDRAGNSIDFTYERASAQDAARIKRIEYTGRWIDFDYLPDDGNAANHVIRFDGTGQSSVAGQSAQSNQIRMRRQIDAIRISTADDLNYKNYRLQYETGVMRGRKRLTRVQECDAAGACLDPIDVSWNGQAALDGAFRPIWPAGNDYQNWLRFDHGVNIIPGDFNGDGKTDFLRQEKGNWDGDYVTSFAVYFSLGNAQFDVHYPGENRKGDPFQDWLRYDPGVNIIPGDYDGDGMTDFIRQEKGNWDGDSVSSFRVYYSNGNGSFTWKEPGNNVAGDDYQHWLRFDHGVNIIPGDYNGDGNTDFIRQEKGNWDGDHVTTFAVYLSRGDRTGYFDIHRPGQDAAGDPFQDMLRFDEGANIIPGDFNGDGSTDFIRQEKGRRDDDRVDSFQVYLSIEGGTNFKIVRPGQNNVLGDPFQDLLRFDPGANIIPGDFNGDGMTDFLRQEKGGMDDDYVGSFQVYLSKGNGHFHIVSPGNPTYYDGYQDWLRADPGAKIITLDYNGDGRTDFIRQERGAWDDNYSNSFKIYISRGDGYFTIRAPGNDGKGDHYQDWLRHDPGANLIPGDFDGDGRSDFIRQEWGAWDNDGALNFGIYFASPEAGQAPLDTVREIQQGPVKHAFAYRRLSEYNPNNATPFPAGYRGFRSSLPVLLSYQRSVPTASGTGTTLQTVNRSYYYSGATLHTGGRGFQGFQRESVQAPEEGERIITDFYHEYPLSGRVKSKSVSPYNHLLTTSRETFDWTVAPGAASASQSVVMTRKTEQRYAGSGVQTVTTDMQYDDRGNLALLSETDGGQRLDTCSEFANPAVAVRPGPVSRIMQGANCSASNNACSCSGLLSDTRFTHDSVGHVLSRREFDGTLGVWLETSYEYDEQGNRKKTTLPTGAIEETVFDGVFRTYPATIGSRGDGVTLAREQTYDPRYGLLKRDADENDAITEWDYDSFGRLTAMRRTNSEASSPAVAEVESHSYSRTGDLTTGGLYVHQSQFKQSWSGSAVVTRVTTHDGLAREIRQEQGAASNLQRRLREFSPRGDLLRESNAHDAAQTAQWTNYTYNRRHRVSQIARPGGATTSVSYGVGDDVCAAHQLRVTAITSGGQGRNAIRCQNGRSKTEKLKIADDAAGTHTLQIFTLDALDRLRGTSDGQFTTTIELDSLGRRSRVTSSERGTIDYTYTPDGHLHTTSINGETRSFVFDAFKRRKSVTYHDGSIAEFEYDAAGHNGGQGRVTAAIMKTPDGSGGVIETSRREYSYGTDGKPAVMSLILKGGADGTFTMRYETDPHGRPARIHYPSGRIVCYERNADGFLESIHSATGNCGDSQAETHAAYSNYSATGQPGRIVYGNGVETDFAYDALNRVETVHTVDSQNGDLLNQRYYWTALNEVDRIQDLAAGTNTDYTYDAYGYLKSATGLPSGDISYDYDPQGKLTRKGDLTFQYDGSRIDTGSNGLNLDYDAHGNVVVRETGANGPEASRGRYDFVYNAQHRIATVAKNNVLAGQYEYDAAGDRIRKIDGNRNETIYVSRELEITRFDDGRLLTTEYVQGPTGRIAAVSEGATSTALIHGTPATHSLQAQMYNTSSIAGLTGFISHTTMAYLRTPSIAATGRALLWALATTATIMAFAVYMLRTARNRSWLGRLRANLATRLAHSIRQRNAAGSDGLLSFATAGEAGDGYHRRRRMLRWPAPVLVATMLAMSMQCGSNNGASNFAIAPPGSGVFAFNFVLGPGGNGYGYPEEGTFYFQYNQVGSTSLVTDSAGAMVARAVYKPFGEIDEAGSDGRDVFRGKFNNNEFDRDSDVHYFNARYYDPLTGGFLQPDELTFGTNGEHAAALNRYAFSGNNPVTYSDPGGNWFWIPLLFFGAALGGTVSAVTYTVQALAAGDFSWEGLFINIGIGALAGALGAGVSGGLTALATNLAARAAWSITQSALRFTASYVAPILGGAVESFASSTFTQMALNNGHVDWEKVGIETGIGTAAGVFNVRGIFRSQKSTSNIGYRKTVLNADGQMVDAPVNAEFLTSATTAGARLTSTSGSRHLVEGVIDDLPRVRIIDSLGNVIGFDLSRESFVLRAIGKGATKLGGWAAFE